jgi:hypothetical protein
MREMLESNEQLNRKFSAVIRKLSEHDNYFKVVFDDLKKFTNPPSSPHRRIVDCATMWPVQVLTLKQRIH